MRTSWQRGTERTIAWPRSSIADADKDRVSFLPGDAAVTSGNRLPVLPMLLVSLMLLGSCATKSNPVVLVRCEDFADGKDNCLPPANKPWMWITIEKAKDQLHWVNHK